MTHVSDNVTDVWLNGEGSGPSHDQIPQLMVKNDIHQTTKQKFHMLMQHQHVRDSLIKQPRNNCQCT